MTVEFDLEEAVRARRHDQARVARALDRAWKKARADARAVGMKRRAYLLRLVDEEGWRNGELEEVLGVKQSTLSMEITKARNEASQ